MSTIIRNYIISNYVKFNSCFRLYSSNKIRVRFAPSPTGLLHLGGLRTALYNHLFAKSQNGITILRIEDTDQNRKINLAAQSLIDDLAWCGIHFDEGPYYQSERTEIYKKYAKQLIEQGDAYYCFCSKSRLDLLRKEALKAGEVVKYDNACRNLSQSEINSKMNHKITPCIRFKLSSYKETIHDLISGSYTFNAALNEGDFIILKADGFPTYHLANIVDDHLMNISHVIRGIEWQLSTFKHLQLYKAFSWKPPEFGHIPLLLNSDGSKLSKRQNDLSIKQLREDGFLPNAVINFVFRYGGGFEIEQWERDKKIFTIQELMEKFDISKINSCSSKISLEQLKNCNNLEIKRLMETEDGLNEAVKKVQITMSKYFQDKSEVKTNLEPDKIKVILSRMKSRISRVEDLFAEKNINFWLWNANVLIEKEDCFVIQNILKDLSEVEWELESLKKFLQNFAEKNNYSLTTITKLLRKILFNNQMGPSVAEIIEILGKNEVELRLSSVVAKNSEHFDSLKNK